ncbi:MAG: redoxin family protein [Acidobacteriota bacterium]|nr:redoxin family protein [Acidobacteriota bacterium]
MESHIGSGGEETMWSKRMLVCAQWLILMWDLGTASAQVVIRGIVTGHDGKPMPTAEVQLANAANEQIDSSIPAADGAFEVQAPAPGLLHLQFAGPLHGQHGALLLVDRPQTISLRAQLSAPDYDDDMANLRLSTSDPKSSLNNTPFVKQSDGTFVAELLSDSRELLLAINGLVKNAPPLAIPGAAEYRCFDNLHCYAVARPSAGKLRVVFDPKLLVHARQPASVRYAEPNSAVAIAGLILDSAEEFNTARRLARQQTALKSGKALNQVPVEPPPAAMVSRVIQAIDGERVPLVRQARLFEYLLMVFLEAPADRALVRRALEELTPASPLWALNFGNVAASAMFATDEPERYIDYAIRIMDAQPSKALKATAAAGIIAAFGESGRTAAAEPLMAKARAEAGEQPNVKRVLAQYGAERRIQKGKPVPGFRAPSLDDPNLVYTEASLRGKVYLIDFWATWCLPCLAEFPGLSKLYEQYRERGFEVLSYSIDTDASLVREFRKKRFALPWLHAIDPQLRELQSPMARDFEVTSIPRPVLVDRNGIVVATDQECRGVKLEEMLRRLLSGAAN